MAPVIKFLTLSLNRLHSASMIRSFFHKGLRELFEKGATARIQKSMCERCVVRLDALDRAVRPDDMNVPGE